MTLLKRMTALLICAVLLSALLGALTLAGHGHDHNGGPCAVCAQIRGNPLKRLCAAVGVISFGLTGLYAFVSILRSVSFAPGSDTPVNMKIRINN